MLLVTNLNWCFLASRLKLMRAAGKASIVWKYVVSQTLKITKGSYNHFVKRMLSICGHMQRLKLCNTAFIRDNDLLTLKY
jgi:hypothetical protein